RGRAECGGYPAARVRARRSARADGRVGGALLSRGACQRAALDSRAAVGGPARVRRGPARWRRWSLLGVPQRYAGSRRGRRRLREAHLTDEEVAAGGQPALACLDAPIGRVRTQLGVGEGSVRGTHGELEADPLAGGHHLECDGPRDASKGVEQLFALAALEVA